MITLNGNGTESDITVRGSTLNDYNFEVTKDVLQDLISEGTSTLVTQNDLKFRNSTGSTYDTQYVFNEIELQQGTLGTLQIENLTPGIISISDNVVSRVATGQGRVMFKTRNINRLEYFQVNRFEGTNASVFDGFVEGSLAKNVSDVLTSKIDGNDESSMPLFTTMNHTTQTYVRNSAWIGNIDVTGYSVWNSTQGQNRAGILISPRHILFAKHYQINNGATVRFVDNDNNVVNRTMTAKTSLGDIGNLSDDFTVGVLNEDVPETIKWYKIIPNNLSNYFSQFYNTPTISFNRQKEVTSQFIGSITENQIIFSFNYNEPISIFHKPKVVGDSGNPIGIIINNEFVLLTVFTYGGAGSGTNITKFKNEINTIMSNLGGGYQLTEIDLTSFPTYGD